jgi:shikimate kinase / 3-dehydroquinate synthase
LVNTENNTIDNESIFLYGPPGSGKSSVGPLLADSLSLPFIDLDQFIEARFSKPIPDIFHDEGEVGFREKEQAALFECIKKGNSIIALGGGALLDQKVRDNASRNGNIICLNANAESLINRLRISPITRPLISDPVKTPENMLVDLLEKRKEHYASFYMKIDTTAMSVDEVAYQAQILAGMFHIRGMGAEYDVRVFSDSLHQLGRQLTRRSLQGPVSVICDQVVSRWYLEPVLESLKHENLIAEAIIIPDGEVHKNIDTVISLWNSFVKAGIDRSGTIIALGGGVVNDLTGFAAATYLRGVKWVAVPTTILSMVDASLGGKTGADLPAGKNLIGAFHAPSLVWVDPTVLKTLAQDEFISGLAEVIKHGIIADPHLYGICQTGLNSLYTDLESVVKRAMAVKIRIIQEDPYENGKRAVLNLGHTLGHAIEKVTNYQIRHGEAVAIGMVAAAKVSEYIKIGENGITESIRNVLSSNYLPTGLPEAINKNDLHSVMMLDKKRRSGMPRLALPKKIGEAVWGIELNDLNLLTDL